MKTTILAFLMTLTSASAFAGTNLRCTLSGKNIETKTALVQLEHSEGAGDDDFHGEAALGELTVSVSRYADAKRIVLYHRGCGLTGLRCLFRDHGSDVSIPAGKDYELHLLVWAADHNIIVATDKKLLKHSYSKGTLSADGVFTPAGRQDEVAFNVSCEIL